MAKIGKIPADLIHRNCGGVIKSRAMTTTGGKLRMQAYCKKCEAVARYPKDLGCDRSDELAKIEIAKSPEKRK